MKFISAIFLISFASFAFGQELPKLPDEEKTEITIPTIFGLRYLSEIAPTRSLVDPGTPVVSKHFVGGFGGEHTLWAGPFVFDGKTYSVHVFSLDKEKAEYDAIVGGWGVDDRRNVNANPMKFLIVGDKKVLWRSEKPVKKSGEGGTFGVKISGVKKLELWVTVEGHPTLADACWIEPLLVPSDFDIKSAISKLREEAKEAKSKEEYNKVYMKSLVLLRVAQVVNIKEVANIRKIGTAAFKRSN